MASLGRQTFALAAGSTESHLFRVSSRPGGPPDLEMLAAFPGPPADPATFAGLGEALAGRRGRLHVSLPLFVFETTALDLPVSSREAIGKVLPYHLGKVLSRPLGDFVFDWQVVREHKGAARVAVFLLPAAIVTGLRRALAAGRVALACVEPDIFSLFAYAGTVSPLPEGESLLAMIVHRDFLVQGFCENGRLRLVRELKLPVPDGPFDDTCVIGGPDEIPFDDGADVLSTFAISAPEQEQPRPEAAPVANCGPWREYFERVNLEVVRGRDYYSSIMKGAATARVIVAGDGDFIGPLVDSISSYGEMAAAALDLPGQGGGSGLTRALPSGAAGRDPGLERVNVLPGPTLGQRLRRVPPVLATALALGLAIFLAADYLRLAGRIATDRARLAAVTRQAEAARVFAASRARLARQIESLAARGRELEKEAALLREADRTKRRYSGWLAAIGRVMPATVRCDRMEFGGGLIDIRGRATDHGAVEDFAERLRRLDRVAAVALEEVRRGDRGTAPLDFRLSCRIKTADEGGEP